jgi:hypothetical protein
MGEPRDVNEKPLCKISQKWKSLVRVVYFLPHGTNRKEVPALGKTTKDKIERRKKKKGRKNTEPATKTLCLR